MPTIFGTENSEILNGGTGSDDIYGYGGNDTLNGNAANDSLYGGAGNDSLVGGTGNDVLDGESGADTMAGDAGNDTFFADDLADRVVGGAGVDYLRLTVDGLTSNLSAVYAGGALTVNGTQVANTVEVIEMSLGSGNDTINAGAFMPLANGTGGYLDGGTGTDTLILDYSIASPQGLTATRVDIYAYSSGTVTLSGGATRNVTLSNFERAQITGTTGSDILFAAIGNSTLIGGGGNDTLTGYDGADSLDGGAGNDILDGSFYAGADTMLGGIGNDTIYADGLTDRVVGGDGVDFLRWDASEVTSDVSAVFAGGALTFNGTQVANTVEVLTLILGSGNDTVSAGALMPLADGNGGYVDAGSGTDTLILDYSVASPLGLTATQIDFNASSGGTVTLTGGGSRYVNLFGFERAQITGTGGSDRLVGAVGDSTLFGGGGTDSLIGYDGADSLDGGAGDDVLDGSFYAGADTMLGGIGNDTISADDLTDRVVGGDGIDYLEWDASVVTSSVSAVFAGGALTFNGTEVANTVEALALTLGSGNDTINAGAFMALADGSGGTLNGGDGTDTLILDYSVASPEGLTATRVDIYAYSSGTVTLSGGATRSVTLSSFERAQITGTTGSDILFAAIGDSTLIGGGGNDTLTGYDGADSLDGGAGNDILDGSSYAGADTMLGGIGNDTIYADDLTDRVVGGDGVDLLYWDASGVTSSVSAVFAGGALTFNGTEVANTVEALALTLGSGNDTIDAGAFMASADGSGGSLNGGDGTDTLILDYSVASPEGLTATRVDASTNTIFLAGGATRSVVNLTGFEHAHVTGTSGSDVLWTAIGDSTLLGGGGDDSLDGWDGADILDGGAGNDSLRGYSGADTMLGGIGNDTIYAVELTDRVIGGDGIDFLGWDASAITTNISAVFAGGALTFNGTEAANTVESLAMSLGSGNDTINAGAFMPLENGLGGYLDGGAGTDTLILNYSVASPEGLTATQVDISAYSNGTVTLSGGATRFLGLNNFERAQITGTGGSDTLFGAIGNSTLIGGGGNDSLTGYDGADSLDGGAGNDTLDGSSYAGADTLLGGIGDDTIYADDLTDRVVGGDGVDHLGWDASGLTSNLSAVFAGGALTLNGTEVANSVEFLSMILGSGNDTINAGAFMPLANGFGGYLDGGAGTDTLILDYSLASPEGLTATRVDIYAWNSGTVTLTGGATRNVTLANFERAQITGTAGADYFEGTSGADTLIGGLGADTMIGGTGNDVYVIDAADTVTENANAGTDLVMSAATTTLGANLENLTLTGGSAINGTGNTLNNLITGNTANNVLNGGTGADTLIGNEGADTLIGGTGNDVFISDGLDTITELANGGTDSVQSSGTITLGANIENLTLLGTAAIDGTGNTAANTITGNSAANVLNGGGGADTLVGGAGDDTYVTDGGDTLTENVDAGVDLVRSSVNFTLGANFENLELTGTATTGTGTEAANRMTGNALGNQLSGLGGSDTLDGGAGADTLIGGQGDDVYVFDGTDTILEIAGGGVDLVRSDVTVVAMAEVENVQLTGLAAVQATGNGLNNSLVGNAAANTLIGLEGSDTLDGGGGVDTLEGGSGDDTYLTDGLDTIVELEAAGIDLAIATGSTVLAGNIENLTLTGALAINGTGNTLANVITGNVEANVLDGVSGVDTLIGGSGNDTYFADGDDVIVELDNGGTDTVQTSASHTLAAFVENLTLTGGAAINGTGNQLDNQITGNAASNSLDGGLGADTLTGGGGNDTYIVDAGDVIIELAGGGVDQVLSSANFTLGAELETLELTGLLAINGTGNALANTLRGNSAANTLDGAGGIDTLIGGLGDDTYVTDGGDTITEAVDEGVDLVLSSVTYTLGANIENLTLTGALAINGTGNTLANVITGNVEANVLDGVSGIDTLVGGSGNDTYVTDGDDVIVELDNGGTDTVQTALSHTLAAFVENLTLTGGAAINGTGNQLDNQITGNAASNSLDGGLGADTLTGGGGNDTYIVDAGDVIIELAGGGVDQVLSSANFTLGAELETLELTGLLAINGTGNALANTLRGNSAANTLDGAGGIDTLIGGLGNDTYVTDGGDTITEAVDEGVDLVLSSGTYTLGANIENLTLTGSSAINGTGNTLANIITGNSGINQLFGGTDLLVDTLIGGGGNDTFTTDGLDLIIEAANEGVDTVRSSASYTLTANVENLILTGVAAINATGNSLANTLTGNNGANILDGGTGVDRLIGGLGDDTYITDGGDTITEAVNGGIDLVLSSATHTLAVNVENLTLTGTAAISGTGNTLANIITGNSGSNQLAGGTDLLADTLIGGGGNDTYTTDGLDTIIEALGGGTDTVRVTASYTLGDNLENLTLIGTTAINGTGNALVNTITGNGAANILDGRGGADRLIGGLGDDVYISEGLDIITEAANAGTDSVQSSGSYTLAVNVEHLILTGNAAINGTGNASANRITGNDAANVISGGVGADTLSGGLGADTLTGGADADVFLFNSAPDLTVDRITDFNGLMDLIHLDNFVFTGLTDGVLVGDAFLANDTGISATATNRLIYETDTGNLFYDADGTGATGPVHIATLTIGAVLASDDFFVI